MNQAYEENENGKTNDQGLSEESLVELLKQRLNEAHSQAKIFMQAFVIYVGIHGLLLTTWVDVNQALNFFLAIIICLAAILVCALVIYVWPSWVSMRKALEEDVKKLNRRLHRPLTSEKLLAMKHITTTSGAFAIVSFFGWMTLLIMSIMKFVK